MSQDVFNRFQSPTVFKEVGLKSLKIFLSNLSASKCSQVF